MSTQTVIYNSTKKLECQCSAQVIICLDKALTANSTPFIDGQLIKTILTVNECLQQVYSYYLEIDSDNLLDPTHTLLNSEIEGIICKGCLTDYIDAKTNPCLFQTAYETDNPPNIVLDASWGTGASIDECSACDNHGTFRITAGSAATATNAVIDLTFLNGPYLNTPVVIFNLVRTSTSDTYHPTLVQHNDAPDGFYVVFHGTPQFNQTYVFNWICAGM